MVHVIDNARSGYNTGARFPFSSSFALLSAIRPVLSPVDFHIRRGFVSWWRSADLRWNRRGISRVDLRLNERQAALCV
jgi:hypothetical protein